MKAGGEVMAYSNDLREKVVEAYENKEDSMRRLAKRFKVSLTFVLGLITLWRETGSVEKRPHGGGTPLKLTVEVLGFIKSLLLEKNDCTEKELQQLLAERHDIHISTSTIGEGIRKLGWSRKKKTFHDPKKDEERVQKEREAFREKVSPIDPEKMVFLDEAGTLTHMARDYGRAPLGERAEGTKPLAGERLNMIGALRLSGLDEGLILEQNINGENFLFFVEHYFVNILRPGDVVFLDNNWFHFTDGVEEIIRSKGASVLYLPPYSPEFNPIEECWSKIKNYLKTLAARTKELLYDAIMTAFQSVTLKDIKGWFHHAGYCV